MVTILMVAIRTLHRHTIRGFQPTRTTEIHTMEKKGMIGNILILPINSVRKFRMPLM
jgi:hypothetical protein